MSKKFPDPLQLPEEVPQARMERNHHLMVSSAKAMVIRTSIIGLELFGFFLFGSSSLLLDALSSMIDVIASIVLLFCIRFAARPPDTNHPFGHGRFEPIAGLQMGMLFIIVGCGMLFQQIFSVTVYPKEEIISPFAWLIAFVAVILMEFCYQMVKKTAKEHNSPALAADAAHYRIDGLTSLVAMVALLIGAFFPAWSHFFDHIGAIIIAGFMVVIGFLASRENLHQLSDRMPSKEYFDLVKKAAGDVEGVLGTEKIRIQLYGPDAHVDIDIEVAPDLSVEVAHEISQRARLAIQKAWPMVRDVTVHIEPYFFNDH